MKCNKLVDIGRRRFLQGGAVAAAGVATLSVFPLTCEGGTRDSQGGIPVEPACQYRGS